MIKVYQIQLTSGEMRGIADGEYTPRIKAYLDRSFDRTFKAENFKYYDHVATVDTDSMEDAFRLMNLWEDPYKVSKIPTRRCSSMSVGDILELEDGTLHRVASWGFTAFDLENA